MAYGCTLQKIAPYGSDPEHRQLGCKTCGHSTVRPGAVPGAAPDSGGPDVMNSDVMRRVAGLGWAGLGWAGLPLAYSMFPHPFHISPCGFALPPTSHPNPAPPRLTPSLTPGRTHLATPRRLAMQVDVLLPQD